MRNFINYVEFATKTIGKSVEDIKAKYQKEFYKDNKENSLWINLYETAHH